MKNSSRKLLIFTLVFAIALLATAVGLLIILVTKPKEIENHYFLGKDGQSIIGPVGPQGPAGDNAFTIVKGEAEKGEKGDQGQPGKDGVNAETIINNITTNVPVPGETGPAGAASPTLRLRIDYTKCIIYTQYEGDDAWQAIAQLPKPCEIEESSDE